MFGECYPWRRPASTLALAGGVLEARAQWMRAGSHDALHGRAVGIFLTFMVPMPLRIWRALGGVELSPQQMEVAFWMGLGGGREAARSNVDVATPCCATASRPSTRSSAAPPRRACWPCCGPPPRACKPACPDSPEHPPADGWTTLAWLFTI